jgi:nuclear pore complex protein Nup107
MIIDEGFKEEYLGWTTFIQAWKSFDAVEEVARSEIVEDTTGADRRTRWSKKYADSLEECWVKTLEVLTSDWPVEFDGQQNLGVVGWLANDKCTSIDEHPNAFDYKRIRRIYIPQLIRRLHKALMTSRRQSPK